MLDFSWITEIPDHLWLPLQGGGHHVFVSLQELAAMSDSISELPMTEVLRKFDEWKQGQSRYYELMISPPGDKFVLLRGPLPTTG